MGKFQHQARQRTTHTQSKQFKAVWSHVTERNSSMHLRQENKRCIIPELGSIAQRSSYIQHIPTQRFHRQYKPQIAADGASRVATWPRQPPRYYERVEHVGHRMRRLRDRNSASSYVLHTENKPPSEQATFTAVRPHVTERNSSMHLRQRDKRRIILKRGSTAQHSSYIQHAPTQHFHWPHKPQVTEDRDSHAAT